VFWVTVPVSGFSLVQILFFLPLKPVTGSFKQKLKKVDFIGSIVSLTSTILILVPISSGGSTFAWDSPVVIVLLVLGVLLIPVLIYVEYKAPLPIIPLRLLKTRSLALLTAISFLAGIYFFGNAYFLPIYFQIILSPVASPLESSGLLQALMLPQIGTAMMAGFVLQRFKPLSHECTYF